MNYIKEVLYCSIDDKKTNMDLVIWLWIDIHSNTHLYHNTTAIKGENKKMELKLDAIDTACERE